jgi:Trk K+ transport system NAD-binding subunit
MECDSEATGVFRNGCIDLIEPANWPEGARVTVRLASGPRMAHRGDGGGSVIIAGFGLAGRCVAELSDRAGYEYVIVDRNAETVETQLGLGRRVIAGRVADPDVLRRAGIAKADVLALTIPDEEAVLRATELARRMNPGIYIIARTRYASSGMQASLLGADDVIKSEQAVAMQFHHKLKDRFVRQGHPAC